MNLSANGLCLAARLSDIAVSLRPGDVTAICGPNGAGKSSLLACLAGLLAPDDGKVALGDQPIAALSPRERARLIGYLPQQGEVAWDVSVETLAALGRLPWNAGAAADRAAVDAALAALDLQDLRLRPVSRLSGGEKARALLARVLAGQPRWLLADEPLANLDLAHQLALLRQFRRLAEDGGGVVLVMHDLAQAMNNADRVVVLDGGRVAADGPPETALAAEIIAQVWNVRVDWLGGPGCRALAPSPVSV